MQENAKRKQLLKILPFRDVNILKYRILNVFFHKYM
jgi:hypothetical protein